MRRVLGCVQGAVQELGQLLNDADSFLGQEELGRLPTALTLLLVVTVGLVVVLVRRHWYGPPVWAGCGDVLDVVSRLCGGRGGWPGAGLLRACVRACLCVYGGNGAQGLMGSAWGEK